MMATTLRQMAAPEATVKSEIHMGDVLLLFLIRAYFHSAPVNAADASWFLIVWVPNYLKTKFRDSSSSFGQPS